MRFLVAQIGARRAYAVPEILERAGMLERFYTNVAGNVGAGSVASILSAFPGMPASIERLSRRRVPPAVRAKTYTFTVPGVTLGLRRLTSPSDRVSAFRNAIRYSDDLGRAMAKQGFGKATHVYSMLGECGPLLVEAKKRGLKIISEIYILLSTERIVAEERRQFPDWEPNMPDFTALRRDVGQNETMLRYSDHFICPSPAVRADLIERWGIGAKRTCVVPYGVHPNWIGLVPAPVQGRILFAGTAELRKGIHYLAGAAELLAARGRRYEFRVAGNVTPAIAQRRECRGLNFLGRIARDQIQEEFRRADVFVLPSLAEGSAEVTYEALASSLPVVTTAATGSVVRDGIEGRVLAGRDADELANAIEGIIEDRVKREAVAAASLERARDYTWEKYGERLIAALTGFE